MFVCNTPHPIRLSRSASGNADTTPNSRQLSRPRFSAHLGAQARGICRQEIQRVDGDEEHVPREPDHRLPQHGGGVIRHRRDVGGLDHKADHSRCSLRNRLPRANDRIFEIQCLILVCQAIHKPPSPSTIQRLLCIWKILWRWKEGRKARRAVDSRVTTAMFIPSWTDEHAPE
jgi:hypothetical protein